MTDRNTDLFVLSVHPHRSAYSSMSMDPPGFDRDPPSSQLTSTQYFTRVRALQNDSGLDVQWQNSQSATCAPLAALMAEAQKPRSRPHVPSYESLPLFGSSSAEASTSARIKTESRPRSSRPRAPTRTSSKASKSTVDSPEAADFLGLVKNASELIDENARLKQKRLEKRAKAKPRQSGGVVSRKGKEVERGVPAVRERSLDELYDQTEVHVGTLTRPPSLSPRVRPVQAADESLMSVDPHETVSMDVDSPVRPPSKLSRESSSASSAAAGGFAFPPPVTEASPAVPPDLRPSNPAKSLHSRASTSTPESPSISTPSTSSSSGRAPSMTSTTSPPMTAKPHQAASASRSIAKPPAPPPVPAPRPTPAPRASQHPPILGMRRVIPHYSAGASTTAGPSPSQALRMRRTVSHYSAHTSTAAPLPSQNLHKIPPFRPPVARHPPPPPPPPPAVQEEDHAPGDADSSMNYGDISFDPDLFEEAMQKYD